jgi:hypothetical protein
MADPITTAPVAAPVTTSAAPAAQTPVPSPAEAAKMTSEPAIKPVAAPEAPKQTAEAKKAEQKLLKQLKLKVDGKEETIEFDPNDEEFLTRQFQMAKMGNKRAQEAAQLQKEVGQFLKELKENPKKVLANPNIGIDVKQLAAQIIEEEIENSKKSPEQLEKEKLEQQLRELQEEREREKQTLQQQEFERLQATAYERYDLQMTEALSKSDLPKSPYVVKKMADYMLLGLQNGVDVTPQDVLPLVREEMQSDIKQMFSLMPDEIIESIVGKDVINRIRKKSVAKAKAAPVPVNKVLDTGKTGKTESKEPIKKVSFKDFFGV